LVEPAARGWDVLSRYGYTQNPSAIDPISDSASRQLGSEVKEKLQQHGEEGYSLFCFRTADLFGDVLIHGADHV